MVSNGEFYFQNLDEGTYYIRPLEQENYSFKHSVFIF